MWLVKIEVWTEGISIFLSRHDMIPFCKERFSPALALPLVVLCEVSQLVLE